MVMQTLCEDDKVNAKFAHHSSECFEEASSMIFVYSIVWFLMFWSYGFPLLKSLSNNHISKESTVELVAKSSAGENVWKNYAMNIAYSARGCISLDWMKSVFLSPSMVGIYIGLLVGLVPPLQQGLFNQHGGDPFNGMFRPLGSAIVTLGEPLICVNCLVMAVSLAQTDLGITAGIRFAQSMIDSFLFRDVESLQLIRIGYKPQAKDAPSSSIPTQDEEYAPVIAMKSDEEKKPKSAVPKLRTIATHLLCRFM